ncbi:MAG: RNA-binding S4 domain-containing protein [Micrococcaceae bacterium]
MAQQLYLKDDMIRLGQALKLANVVYDGAEAREVIAEGLVTVNGKVVTQRGKQLHPGDKVSFSDETFTLVKQ